MLSAHFNLGWFDTIGALQAGERTRRLKGTVALIVVALLVCGVSTQASPTLYRTTTSQWPTTFLALNIVHWLATLQNRASCC